MCPPVRVKTCRTPNSSIWRAIRSPPCNQGRLFRPLTEDIAAKGEALLLIVQAVLTDPHDPSEMHRDQQGAAGRLIDFAAEYFSITNPGPGGPDNDGR